MKKLIVLLLTAIMVMQCSLFAFAEETEVTVPVAAEAAEVQETAAIVSEVTEEETSVEEEKFDSLDLDVEGAVNDAYQNAIASQLSKTEGASGFVYRLYKLVLNREPDSVGWKDWTNKLTSKTLTGAQVADGFIYSDELARRNLSDSAYVEMLYKTFLNRSSDKSGKSYWLDKLTNGMSRAYVYRGFANSVEFGQICSEYGINQGPVVLTEARDQNEGVTMFVYRCYKVFLGRKADVDGLNYWTNLLNKNMQNPKQVAWGFVFSAEFEGMNTSNKTYVETLYKGLFDRSADSIGLNEWVNKLNFGYDRQAIFFGFGDSQEFRALAASFGLESNWVSTPHQTYISNSDFNMSIPENWLYDCVPSYYENGNRTWYSFYEKSNYEAGYGGLLFSIALYEDNSFLNLADFMCLGYRGGTCYVVVYPSDVQFDYENSQRTANYQMMSSDIDNIIDSFYELNDLEWIR